MQHDARRGLVGRPCAAIPVFLPALAARRGPRSITRDHNVFTFDHSARSQPSQAIIAEPITPDFLWRPVLPDEDDDMALEILKRASVARELCGKVGDDGVR